MQLSTVAFSGVILQAEIGAYQLQEGKIRSQDPVAAASGAPGWASVLFAFLFPGSRLDGA
jgi:hypothetical protein